MPDSLTEAMQPRGVFSVGSTLHQTFAQLFARLPAFLLLAMLPGVPELLYSMFLLRPTPESMQALRIISFTCYLSLYPFAQGAITHATFQSLRGRQMPLKESLTLATSRLRAILLASIWSGLLVVLGSVLLVVPGIILLTRYFVVIPACLIEGIRAGASLKRSAELTAGFRWKIFGLSLITLVAALILIAVMATASALLALWIGTGKAHALVNFLVGGAALAYSTVLSTVTYHQLRLARDGLDSEQIAEIFD